jgi:hypothetical protein
MEKYTTSSGTDSDETLQKRVTLTEELFILESISSDLRFKNRVIEQLKIVENKRVDVIKSCNRDETDRGKYMKFETELRNEREKITKLETELQNEYCSRVDAEKELQKERDFRAKVERESEVRIESGIRNEREALKTAVLEFLNGGMKVPAKPEEISPLHAKPAGKIPVNKELLLRIEFEKSAMSLEQGLSSAAGNNRKDMVDYMLSHGANNLDLALTEAARNNHKEMVYYMIFIGAKNGLKVLGSSTINSHEEMIQYLMTSLRV